MNKSESITALATAMAKAQGAIKSAIRGADNPFFHSRYADLAGVWAAARPPLDKNGLSVIQTTRMEGDQMVLETMLLHESGEWISGEMALRPGREKRDEGYVASDDPQAVGSALTYARRYALAAICGVATEDDDGEAAMGRNHAPAGAAKASGKTGVPPPPSNPGEVGAEWHPPKWFSAQGGPATLGDCAVSELEKLRASYARTLANPDKVQYHDRARSDIALVLAETVRRKQ